MSDERRAIVDRREQIAAEPRPSKQQATPEVKETDDVLLVYIREWVTMAASTHKEDLEDLFKLHYEGRVYDEHWMIHQQGRLHLLLMFLPNVKGQFKHRERAEEWAEQQGWEDFQIVSRNSREDHIIREYGKKMLVKK